eukprot:TRINITY_DN292_c0_g1_i1.p1 TRINITY_DN292_c0_g1~~TRINITY_DN292_c0_g1_i1.p1  ORF type:complete len:123 (+),score=28.48 TRINITY_DN292_c0_g1_i1:124-492(+)
MGNNTSVCDGNSEEATSFNPYNFVRPGISIQEVQAIKQAFDKMKPKMGRVHVADFIEYHKGTFAEGKIEGKLRGKTSLTFEEYNEIISVFLLEHKKTLPDVEFDSNPRHASCLLCPMMSTLR